MIELNNTTYEFEIGMYTVEIYKYLANSYKADPTIDPIIYQDDMICKIQLNKGKILIIDTADLPIVQKYHWKAIGTRGLLYAKTRNTPGKKEISVHRLLMNPLEGMVVDHINHDTMDNRRVNLRICTAAQNSQNVCKYTDRIYSSNYKGVSRTKGRNRYKAEISYNGRTKYIGTYESELDAAKAYNAEAARLFGEYACLNSIP